MGRLVKHSRLGILIVSEAGASIQVVWCVFVIDSRCVCVCLRACRQAITLICTVTQNTLRNVGQMNFYVIQQ